MFNSSVVSYAERGNYGNSKYRGNTTGKIIVDLIESFLPKNGLFIDPAVGSNTSGDVMKSLGLSKQFIGLDLHSGYSLIRDDLLSKAGQPADLVFFHPPYGDMIKYSNNMWGNQDHKDDLSHMNDADFTRALKLALINISDAVKPGGHYAVLIGNQRKNGVYKNWSSLTEKLAPDPLVEEIIKIQNNCTSDTRNYRKNLIRINHEKLLVFKRSSSVNAITSLEKSLMTMSSKFMDELLVTLKRMLQCYEFSEFEILDRLKHLYQEGPFDFSGSITMLLNSEHFVQNNGRYRIA